MSHAERDAAYRAALGIPDGQPLPNTLGQTQGHAHNPSAKYVRTGFQHSAEPPGTNLGACDTALRRKRRHIAQRAVPEGDIDAQLDEYAEAIESAELARDCATNRAGRLAAGSYLLRLRDRRDALIEAASVG